MISKIEFPNLGNNRNPNTVVYHSKPSRNYNKEFQAILEKEMANEQKEFERNTKSANT